jgi:hypothetical protein
MMKHMALPVLLPLLSLVPGCAVATEPPAAHHADFSKYYADFRQYNIHVTAESYRRRVEAPTPQNGPAMRVVALSDGRDAIELRCGQQADLDNKQPREVKNVTGERCKHEALTMCRERTGNGKSTFALMSEATRFDGTDKLAMEIYVRCLTPNEYQTMVRAMNEARREWEKQGRESGLGREK